MPKNSLLTLNELLPTTFDDFFAPWNDWTAKQGFLNRPKIPALNVAEDDKQYTVTLAAPGLDKENFSIDLNDDLLTISASSEKEEEEDLKKYTRKEYSYNSFSRSFTIPQHVKADSIDATYDKGILTLVLPKKDGNQTANGQKINVK
ncbi:Hsp20/alpha crystallin family protein [Chitinophagaceae bacterium MMS25-I14]